MKSYRDIVDRLSIEKVCFGGCGLGDTAHRGSLFLGVLHWADRRVTKRGIRRLLLLAARRERLTVTDHESAPTRGYRNDPADWAMHLYLDEKRANEWAAQIGVRFPVEFSAPERRTASLVPGLSPAIAAWARRA